MRKPNFTANSLISLAIMLLLPLTGSAQWSSNPLENSGIAVATGDQVTPKMVETSDGGCYISWFDNRSGIYCMYLQRLNSLGEAQWTPNGLLISNHPQMTWLVDYDLTVDQNDNAILVFSDIRNGGTNDLDVFAYKIAPDGSFLWGANGVALSEPVNTNFEPAAKVAVTSAGNSVVVWQKSGDTDIICLQKISSTGQTMWGVHGITISPGASESLSAPVIAPAMGDAVIILWKNSTGPPWSPTTLLYTQKFDPNGNPVWTPSGVLIYDLGDISAWTYPKIYSDEAGGAFYCWHDSPSSVSFTVRVGHTDAGGNLIFPLNGVLASTYSSRLHMNPTLSYTPAIGLFAFWVEENSSQSQYGIYGQKFSTSGARLWGDSGMQFIGLGTPQISFALSGPTADNYIYIGYFESPLVLNTAVKAFKVNTDGAMQWSPVVLSDASLGSKDDLLMVVNSENRAFLAWSDGRDDSGDIYAQNVNPDGTLGNPGANPQVSVTLTPLVLPPQNPMVFNIQVANFDTITVSFELWTMVTLPSGVVYGPVIGPVNLTFIPGFSAERNRYQSIPANAPAGTYTYDAYVGEYPDDIWDEDHFEFSVIPPLERGNWGNDWIDQGEGFVAAHESQIANQQSPITNLEISPNPFNASTAISFEVVSSGEIKLAVYDIQGREIASLAEGFYSAGKYEVIFNAHQLSSGVYFINLNTGEFQLTQKLLLIK